VTTSHWPEDMTPEAARLLLALSTIFELQEVEGGIDSLLSDFLRTAWPSPRAQRQ